LLNHNNVRNNVRFFIYDFLYMIFVSVINYKISNSQNLKIL